MTNDKRRVAVVSAMALRAAMRGNWPLADSWMMMLIEHSGAPGVVDAVKLWIELYIVHGSGKHPPPSAIRAPDQVRSAWMNDQQWWAAQFIRARMARDFHEQRRLWLEPAGALSECIVALLSLIAAVIRSYSPGYARNEEASAWRFILIEPRMAHLN